MDSVRHGWICIWEPVWDSCHHHRRMVWLRSVYLVPAFPSLTRNRSIDERYVVFGDVAHMSENVGFVLLPLSIGGNILSFMFGQVLDSHTPGRESALPALSFEGMPAQNQCMLGRECYVASLWVSLLLSVVALGLSMWIGIRDGNGERRRKDTAVHVDDRDV